MRVVYQIVGILLMFHSVVAQVGRPIETPYNCDAMLAVFDNVAAIASSDAGKGSFVIVVAYLGRGELSRLQNQQRLKALEFYLTRRRGLPEERLILAEGKKRHGLAKIEFYIGGKLSDELFLEKKRRVCTSCCPSTYLSSNVPFKQL